MSEKSGISLENIQRNDMHQPANLLLDCRGNKLLLEDRENAGFVEPDKPNERGKKVSWSVLASTPQSGLTLGQKAEAVIGCKVVQVIVQGLRKELVNGKYVFRVRAFSIDKSFPGMLSDLIPIENCGVDPSWVPYKELSRPQKPRNLQPRIEGLNSRTQSKKCIDRRPKAQRANPSLRHGPVHNPVGILNPERHDYHSVPVPVEYHMVPCGYQEQVIGFPPVYYPQNVVPCWSPVCITYPGGQTWYPDQNGFYWLCTPFPSTPFWQAAACEVPYQHKFPTVLPNPNAFCPSSVPATGELDNLSRALSRTLSTEDQSESATKDEEKDECPVGSD